MQIFLYYNQLSCIPSKKKTVLCLRSLAQKDKNPLKALFVTTEVLRVPCYGDFKKKGRLFKTG
jgi:hypothetical protein